MAGSQKRRAIFSFPISGFLLGILTIAFLENRQFGVQILRSKQIEVIRPAATDLTIRGKALARLLNKQNKLCFCFITPCPNYRILLANQYY